MYHGKADKIAGLARFNLSIRKFVSFVLIDVGPYDGLEISDKFVGSSVYHG